MRTDEPLVGIARLRWPSDIAEAEELLTSAGIEFELVELFDGEELELRVPAESAAAARELLAR